MSRQIPRIIRFEGNAVDLKELATIRKQRQERLKSFEGFIDQLSKKPMKDHSKARFHELKSLLQRSQGMHRRAVVYSSYGTSVENVFIVATKEAHMNFRSALDMLYEMARDDDPRSMSAVRLLLKDDYLLSHSNHFGLCGSLTGSIESYRADSTVAPSLTPQTERNLGRGFVTLFKKVVEDFRNTPKRYAGRESLRICPLLVQELREQVTEKLIGCIGGRL